MASFSALPSKWILNGNLKDIKGHSRPGLAIGSLKVLIALNIEMDYGTQVTDSVSFTKLADVTDLSRPMIGPAIKKLEEVGLIQVDRTKKVSRYKFLNFEPWAKVPKRNIRRYLSGLSNRSLSSLASLKIFLCLLAFRDSKSNGPVFISHERLREMTGLQARVIRSGIDILIDHQLITVYKHIEKGGVYKTPNQYTILHL